MRMGRSAQGIRIRPLTLRGTVLGQRVIRSIPRSCCEGIRPDYGRCVVTQEVAPSLRRRSKAPEHALRDARLKDLETELEQLAMDARRFPQWICRAHPRAAAILGRLRERDSQRRYRRKPARCQCTGSDGLRTDGNQRYSRIKNQAISVRELDTTAHPPQHKILMSERRVLRLTSALRLERRGEQGQQEAE